MTFPVNGSRAGGSLMVLILGAITIGFTPIFVRYSETGFAATAFWRMALAVPVISLWLAPWKGSSARDRVPGNPWPLLLLSGTLFGVELTIWHWSIHLTTVANATLELNLGAVFVPLFGWLFLGQRVSRSFLGALVISLVGTVLLVGGDGGDCHTESFGRCAGSAFRNPLLLLLADCEGRP